LLTKEALSRSQHNVYKWTH